MSIALPELDGLPFVNILKEVWQTGHTYMARDISAMLEVDGKLQEFYFDFEYKAILDERGKTVYILHTTFEVSERMAAYQLAEE